MDKVKILRKQQDAKNLSMYREWSGLVQTVRTVTVADEDEPFSACKDTSIVWSSSEISTNHRDSMLEIEKEILSNWWKRSLWSDFLRYPYFCKNVF